MRRQVQLWVVRILVIGLIALAVWRWGVPLYGQYFSQKKKSVYVPTTTIRSGLFMVSFHEIGTLEAENSVMVNTEVGGKIIYLVQDGATVRSGDVIAEMDTTELEREIRQQKLSYQNALADVDRAKAELEILKESNRTELEKQEAEIEFNRTELARAKSELENKKRLLEEKLIRKAEVDQADFEVRSKTLSVLKGEKDLALKKKDIESKEQQKMAEVRNKEFAASINKVALEDSENRTKAAVVRAPANGLVVISKDWTPDGRRRLQEGDTVRPRMTLCSLPDLSSMLVKVNVGESDAPRVRTGMPVLIRLEAIPGKTYHGTVDSVSSLATEASFWESGATPGRKNFEVKIRVKEADPKNIKPGMTADCEFISDSVTNALFVPIESVVERGGKTYVFVKKGKRFERVPVKTGKQNDNFVCINKGLEKGRVIALRDPTKPLDVQEAGVSAPAPPASEGAKAQKQSAPIPQAAPKK